MTNAPPGFSSSLSAVALAFLEAYDARFDPAARADEETLRAALAKRSIAPWPVLFEIERAFGGLRFGESLFGPYCVIKRAPRLRSTRSQPAPLVCVGVNDTGRLLVDELGRIWDEDAAATA